MADTIILDLDVETKKAISSVKKFSSKAQKSVENISTAFTGLGALAAGALAGIGIKKFVGVLGDAADAAIVQENAIKKMNTALAISGEFSEEASQDMQDYASALQAVTTVGDEAALEQIALAKSMGATNDQAKQVTTAAANLSASMGISLETATRQISKTLGGVAGRLADVIPELRGMTAEQLKAGAAIDLVAGKFEGAAGAITQTFGGALTQSQNLVGDLQEELGFLVTKNTLVTKAIGLFSKAISKAIKVISNNRKAIIEFVNKALKAMVSYIPTFLKGIRHISDAFQGIALVSSTARLAVSELILGLLEFDIVTGVVNGVTDVFRGMGIAVLAVIDSLLEGLRQIPGVSGLLDAVGLNVDELTDSIENAGASLINNLGSDVTEDIKSSMRSMRDSAIEDGLAIEEGFSGINSAIDTTIDGTQELVDNILEIGDAQEESSDKAIEALNKQAKAKADAAKPGGKDDKAAKAAAAAKKKKEDAVIGVASGVISAAGQGENATQALVSSAVGGVVGFFLGDAFGGLISGIINLLATDGAAEMVAGMIDGIPEFVAGMISNAPLVAIALVETILSASFWSRLVIGLISSWAELIKTLVIAIGEGISQFFLEAIPKAVADLSAGIGNFFDGFGATIKARIDKWISGLQKFFNQMEAFFTGIGNLFKDLEEAIRGLIPSGGGAKVKEKVGGFFKGKFAEGGQVPGGYPGDTFPALLSSGENVITKDTTQELDSFLARQDVMEGLLMQVASAVSAPVTVTTSAQVDGTAFADIMLELERTGARTA